MRHIIPNKVRDLNLMWADIDEVFQRFFRGFPKFGWVNEMEVTPYIDLYETEDDIIVKVEIPGVDIKDVEITLLGKILSINGKKKRHKETKEESIHHLERSYGVFARKISLPCEVMQKEVKATYEKGVLNIWLPKCEKAKKTQIKIGRGRLL